MVPPLAPPRGRGIIELGLQVGCYLLKVLQRDRTQDKGFVGGSVSFLMLQYYI